MIILCADDYGLTDGVSRAIENLAARKRLSATSALVTGENWPHYAPRLARLRGDVSTGIHLNLTLGKPLGAMPALARNGRFPQLGKLIRLALLRQVKQSEVEEEFARQFERFTATLGSPPDHIDGHQHVHALPMVREALVSAIKAQNWKPMPLVRCVSDTLPNIIKRRQYPTKSLVIATLSAGLGKALRDAGVPSNDTFSGVSGFRAGTDFRAELAASLSCAGGRHLVMCHPGFADEELRGLDPVVERREEEYQALMDAAGLAPRIWHPDRPIDGPAINWGTER